MTDLVHIVATLLFAGLAHAKTDDVCAEWFRKSGVSNQSKDCVLRCDILPKDMSTFTCADRCDEFCKPQKCSPAPYWKDKIKSGRPDKWDIPSEATAVWTETEKKKLLTLLSRLPGEFESIPFDGFYRLKKSVDIINPATTAADGKSIAIYDRAFANPFFFNEQGYRPRARARHSLASQKERMAGLPNRPQMEKARKWILLPTWEIHKLQSERQRRRGFRREY